MHETERTHLLSTEYISTWAESSMSPKVLRASAYGMRAFILPIGYSV